MSEMTDTELLDAASEMLFGADFDYQGLGIGVIVFGPLPSGVRIGTDLRANLRRIVAARAAGRDRPNE